MAKRLFTCTLAAMVLVSMFVFSSAKVEAQSLEEMLLYREAYYKCENALQTMLNNLGQLEEYIDKNKDPQYWEMYSDCYNSVSELLSDLNTNGLSAYIQSRRSELAKQSNSVFNKISGAINRRYKLAQDQYNRLRSIPGIKCDRYYADISLDEFLNGNTPSVNYYQ